LCISEIIYQCFPALVWFSIGLKRVRAHKLTFPRLFSCKIWAFLCFRAKPERSNLPFKQREIWAYESALVSTLALNSC